MSARDWRLTTLAVLLLGGGLLWLGSRKAATPAAPVPVPGAGLPAPVPMVAGSSQGDARPTLPGEAVMAGYGMPDSPPAEDLVRVARLLDCVRLLCKGPDPLPLGANEEITAAILGRNRIREPFLPPGHPAIDAAGRMVDRWGTPLFFHVESADRISLRSAGPDREMWTDDDLERKAPQGR